MTLLLSRDLSRQGASVLCLFLCEIAKDLKSFQAFPSVKWKDDFSLTSGDPAVDECHPSSGVWASWVRQDCLRCLVLWGFRVPHPTTFSVLWYSLWYLGRDLRKPVPSHATATH